MCHPYAGAMLIFSVFFQFRHLTHPKVATEIPKNSVYIPLTGLGELLQLRWLGLFDWSWTLGCQSRVRVLPGWDSNSPCWRASYQRYFMRLYYLYIDIRVLESFISGKRGKSLVRDQKSFRWIMIRRRCQCFNYSKSWKQSTQPWRSKRYWRRARWLLQSIWTVSRLNPRRYVLGTKS